MADPSVLRWSAWTVCLVQKAGFLAFRPALKTITKRLLIVKKNTPKFVVAVLPSINVGREDSAQSRSRGRAISF